MSVVMALSFLPWLVVVLCTAGGWAALVFVAYTIVVFATGYGMVWAGLPVRARSEIIVFAPAVGILAISALTSFWLRLGLPLIWVPALWLGLAAVGLGGFWRDCALRAKDTVAYGGALVILSMLICAVYFLPSACKDAVLRRDGSFSWIYVDTQWFESMSAGIEIGESPPRDPGTATAELLYHFGPYTPAAVVSHFTGLELGDALARVTRGASLWALVLSCFGLGTLLSLKATGERFGGIMSVAGLFFYGSLLSLFSDDRNSSSHVTGGVLFTIPRVEVLADGGPFSHLILGHSVLHGLGAITSIMGLYLIQRKYEAVLSWRGLIFLMLPAFAVPVHSVAALYCLAVAGILLFWNRVGTVRSSLQILVMLCLFLGTWMIMGYGHAPDATLVTFNKDPYRQWWMLAVWFMVGLGFRILGFRWISRQPWKDPLSVLVLASVLGLLSFTLLLQFPHGEQRYGMYFLQSLLSIFAFSQLTAGSWRGAKRAKWIAEWLALATKVMILLVFVMATMRIFAYAIHSQAWIASLRLEVLPCLILLVLLVILSVLMKRSRHFSRIGSAVLMGLLLIGFLGWITPWIDFGLGRMRMDVILGPGEVQGLHRLGKLAAPGERFATNRHAIDSLASYSERSYAYVALSERPVLLEGYGYRETALPGFTNLLGDNELMFSTTDSDTLRNIAKNYGIRWLVARPGTDISLPKPRPAWLVEQQDCGDLKIYHIDSAPLSQ